MIRPEDVRELLKRQPFQAFRIHMSNGQTYVMNHPELALVTRGTIVVSQPAPGSEEPIGEGISLVSVLHINNIETLPSAAPSKKA